tara:strand:+ start:2371 stop:2670 length:300 start_codon:yes stop_codon:yes gene_type:complete
MKKTINRYEFASWFAEHRPNNFSPIGRMELFDMLTDIEDATGEEIEFDPISLCCEYSEYENMEEFWLEYDKEDYPNEESIMYATFYWAFGDGSFIIQKF